MKLGTPAEEAEARRDLFDRLRAAADVLESVMSRGNADEIYARSLELAKASHNIACVAGVQSCALAMAEIDLMTVQGDGVEQ